VNKPPSDELLKMAARLRAGGSSWDVVAKEVGRTKTAPMRWPEMYRVKWAFYYAEAERQILEEASAESIHVLRQQLKSRDEGSSRDAAGKLIRAREGAEREPAEVSPEALALAQYLEGLTDADLRALTDRIAPRFGYRRCDEPGGDESPAGAA
jgi:hypothetical protein